VFLILGAAGVLFSLAFALVREPQRLGVAANATSVPLREVIGYLWQHRRAVLCHNFGFAMIALASYSGNAWIPSFFIRSYGAAPGEFGITFGIILAIFGCAGIVTGGRLADYWLRQGKSDAALRVGIVAAALALPSHLGLLVPSSATLAWIFLAPATFFLAMPSGASAAAIQEIVPNRMRAQTSAVLLFIVNVIGLGIGPTAVASITDFVFHDDLAVRWSILIITSIGCLSAMALLAAGMRPYREMRARMR
jgi:hypothetical protein